MVVATSCDREPMRTPSTFLVLVCSMLVAAANPSAAAPGSGWRSEAATENADYAVGQAAVKAGNYRQAIESLTKAEEAEPNNANVLNLLGFSYRKLGEFEQSLSYYQRALTLEPQHRGANEYLGELYLQMGDLLKAEERLARLDRICTFGCEEYSDLKKAIKEYKAGRSAAKGS
jgi:tetratricopeptide (TPR) repeat protein